MDNLSSDIANNRKGRLHQLIKGLKEWVLFLLKRWMILILIPLIAGVGGFLFAWKSKPKFESKLSFALEENSGGLSGALSLAAELGLNLGSNSNIFSGDNILQIIASRRVIESVLLSVDSGDGQNQMRTMAQYLNDLKNEGKKPEKYSNPINNVKFPVGKLRSSFTYLEDSALFLLYERDILENLIAARPDKKFAIYEIRFTSSNERFSKIFTEKLLEETIKFYTELRSKKSRQTLELLESRVASLRSNARSSIYGSSNIQDANLNSAFAAAQAPLREKQVDLSATSGAYAELFKNLELARFQYLQDVPLLQVIDDVNYPLKKIKRGRMLTGLLFAFICSLLTVGVLSLEFLLQKEKELINA